MAASSLVAPNVAASSLVAPNVTASSLVAPNVTPIKKIVFGREKRVVPVQAEATLDDPSSADDHPIGATYTNDCNIFRYDEIVRNKLASKNLRVRRLEKELVELDQFLATPRFRGEIVKTEERRKEIEEEIRNIKGGFELKEYTVKVQGILREYQGLGQHIQYVSFGKKSEIKQDTHQEQRHRLIREYFRIAGKYVKVAVVRIVPDNPYCIECQTDLREVSVDETTGIQICPGCGNERAGATTNHPERDRSKNGRNEYEQFENFKKTVRNFQGKQSTRIIQEIMVKLDVYFTSFGRVTGQQIRDQYPLNDNARRADTNRALLTRALAEIGCSSNYEDINLIGHIYWGWPLPDISEIEDTIMEDYLVLQRVYLSLDVEWSSSLNAQFILFKLIEARQESCTRYTLNEDDFKMLGRDPLIFHEKVWAMMIEGAARNGHVIRYIPSL